MTNTIQKLFASDILTRLASIGSTNLDILNYLLEKEKLDHIHIETYRRKLSRDLMTFEEVVYRILFLEAIGLIDKKEAASNADEGRTYILAPGVAEALPR